MNRVQQQIIKEALEYPHLLTEWEVDFIDSLADRDDDYELSSKQNEIVNRIGSKVAAG